MSEEETLSSKEASPEVRSLVEALHPWPTSNERAYWIVNEHMKDILLAKRSYKMSYAVWKHLGESALEALHGVIEKFGPYWVRALPETTVLDVQYAFRKEEEVCGKPSSGSSQTPSPKDSSV